MGRCAARVEKGKDRYADSSTLNEEWVKKVLGEIICVDNIYDEEMVRNKVERF